jgi:hypothetical protein
VIHPKKVKVKYKNDRVFGTREMSCKFNCQRLSSTERKGK